MEGWLLLPNADIAGIPQRAGHSVSRLRIIYRSHDGENSKHRPVYYSKDIALISMLRAARGVQPAPDIIFVNDGPIHPARIAVMQAAGELVAIAGGSNRASFRAAVSLSVTRNWDDHDLVWFAEDDYLYAPESLRRLTAAAARLSWADLFSMYGSEALDTSASRRRPRPRTLPGALGDANAVTVEQVQWYRSMATTSTFGIRPRALRQDARLLRASPYTGGAWDRTTNLTAAGYQPFRAAELVSDLLPGSALSVTLWPRSFIRGVVRAGFNLRAIRRPTRRRVMICSDPELISHMEPPPDHVRTGPSPRSAGTDWPGIAADTVAWATARGLFIPISGSDPSR